MTTLWLALRATFFYLVLGITTFIFTMLILLSFPLPFRWACSPLSRMWCLTALWSGRLICGLKYKIIGLEHLPKTPVIFLAKHQSAWETLILPAVLPPIACVCKEALLRIPFFGWSLRLSKNIPIDRKAGIQAFKKVLALGKARMKEGLSILIFPEGTRVAPLTHPKFHKTATMLALAAGVPIIPIAHNSGQCWRRNHFIKTPGTITVIIGPPIATQGKTSEAINTEAYEWIKTQMESIEPQPKP